MAILKNNFVINGHFSFNPSKMSETIGLRVYAKLKAPKGLFFRNPSLMGVYSENLRAGEIEFVFGIDTDQVPFIGKIKTMLMVKDTTGKYRVVEHGDAQIDFSILSTDIASNFRKAGKSPKRPFYDKDVWNSAEAKDLEEKREFFEHWLYQRKEAYYEGFRAINDPDARKWFTVVDPETGANFDAVKLELAKEYWWFMRLGFVKPGAYPGGYSFLNNPETTLFDEPGNGNMTALKEGVSIKVIATTMNEFFSKVNQTIKDDTGTMGSYNYVSYSQKQAVIDGGRTINVWVYDSQKESSSDTSDRSHDSNWMQYWQEYFLLAENDDDNDDIVKNYTSTKTDYIGGVSKPEALYFSNIMEFKRPWDPGPVKLAGAVPDRNNLQYYKIRMRMNTPGERYYVGVMLIHKQEIVASSKYTQMISDPVFKALTKEEQDILINRHSNLNSNIIFTPMLARPDVPDWLDSTDKGMLPGSFTPDVKAEAGLLNAPDRMEAEGANWTMDPNDPDVSLFNLLWALPADVDNNISYNLKEDLTHTKFFLQSPFPDPAGTIGLIELDKVNETNPIAAAVTEARGRLSDEKLNYVVVESKQGTDILTGEDNVDLDEEGMQYCRNTIEANHCEISPASIVLNIDQQAMDNIITTEKRNGQVRKFYIFYAEKTETYFRLQDEPIEITNRDWADVKTIGKFDPYSKFILRRFSNDVNDASFAVYYKRNYKVYEEDEVNPGVWNKSTTFYAKDAVGGGYDVFMYGATPLDDIIVEDSVVKAPLDVRPEEDLEEANMYTFDGTNFRTNPGSQITSVNQRRGDLVYQVTTDINDNTLIDLTQSMGHPEYTVARPHGGLALKFQDAFMITDKIRIDDDTFETAKQRAYCIASIIPTDKQSLNYYVYTNVTTSA